MESVIYIIVGIIVGFFVASYFWKQKNQADREQFIRENDKKIKKAREESVQMSRNTLRGKVAEQMAPMLSGFDYLPSDSKFVGDPIDYIVFDGYSEFRDDGVGEDEIEVVILDIKSGRASLTKGQRQIAQAVTDGRVRFETVRISEDGKVKKRVWENRKKRNGKKAKKDSSKKMQPIRAVFKGEKPKEKITQEIVEKYPRTNARWSDKEDGYLESMYLQGKSVQELAQTIKRNPEKVQARLEKLDVVKK